MKSFEGHERENMIQKRSKTFEDIVLI